MTTLPGPLLRAAAAIVEAAGQRKGIKHWQDIADRLREAAPSETSEESDDERPDERPTPSTV
jgi:hypothetical protein